MDIGDKIRELRKQKGMSQDDLAFEIGVSRQSLSKWENNVMKPNMDDAQKIANFFETTMDALLGYENHANTTNVKETRRRLLNNILLIIGIIGTVITVMIPQIFNTDGRYLGGGSIYLDSLYVWLRTFNYITIIWKVSFFSSIALLSYTIVNDLAKNNLLDKFRIIIKFNMLKKWKKFSIVFIKLTLIMFLILIIQSPNYGDTLAENYEYPNDESNVSNDDSNEYDDDSNEYDDDSRPPSIPMPFLI